MKNIVYDENRDGDKRHNYQNKEMTSTTLKMSIEVENENIQGQTEGKYDVNNIDFGIVERARQRIQLKKYISHLRLTVGDSVISDITLDESGNHAEGESKYVTYMGPTQNTNTYNPGFVKVELDNELLQGSKLEVTYTIKFENLSEVDINNASYYNHGSTASGGGTYRLKKLETGGNIKETNSYWNESQVMKIRPSVIVDYLDRDWGYEADNNSDWKAITKEEYQNNDGTIFKNSEGHALPKADDVLKANEINNRNILYTERLFNEEVLPGSATNVNLKVGKLLTTTDEIELHNDTELLEINKTGGSEILENKQDREQTNPGNNPPGNPPRESDEAEAQTAMVTPSTGKNLGYVVPITIGIVTLTILGVGVIIIKKKVL